MTRKPNLFIIGAPKCATTSLYYYLKSHPQIYMSQYKEPGFFSKDIKRKLKIFQKKDINEYLWFFFKGIKPYHHIIGEASAMYLRSKTAIQGIYDFNNKAKIIAIVRNPVDLVYSYHSQLLWNLEEDEPDFEKAWTLQASRAKGESLPKNYVNLSDTQYLEIGKLGQQVEMVFGIFPKEQIKIIVFDDFIKEPKKAYEDVLSFLSLKSDGRRDFSAINQGKRYKSKLIKAITTFMPDGIFSGIMKSKRFFNIERLGIRRAINSLNSCKKKRKPLREEFKTVLRGVFREDILKLQELIEKDLSLWLR